MKLPDDVKRLAELCQEHSLPIPWLPGDQGLGLRRDDGPDQAYGHVWSAQLAATYEDELDAALAVIDPDSDAPLAAFGIELPRSGRGRPTLNYLLSGPAVHVELSMPMRARTEELRMLGTWLQACSRAARARWNGSTTQASRTGYVLRHDQSACGPLSSGLPTLRWIDANECSAERVLTAMRD